MIKKDFPHVFTKKNLQLSSCRVQKDFFTRKTPSFAEPLIRAVERCGIFAKNLLRPFLPISDWINHMRISEAKWGEIGNDI